MAQNWFDRNLGSNTKIGRVAKRVSDKAGGKGLSDYYGGRGSKGEALRSAATVAATIGTIAAGGVLGAAARGAKIAKATVHGGNMVKFNKTLTARQLQEKATLMRLNKTATLGKGVAKKRAEKAFNDYFKNKR